jgi:hypothetical protein
MGGYAHEWHGIKIRHSHFGSIPDSMREVDGWCVLLRQDFYFQRVVAWEVFFGEGVDFFKGD